MRFTSRQRLPCQQLIARSVHKAKLMCLNLYWELRTLSYFSFYMTTKQASTADFCFHIYLTFFVIHSAATSARSSENIFILHSFSLKDVLNISLFFHDLTLIFKDNLILWDSSQIGARSAGKCSLDHSFFMIFLQKFLTTRNKLARAARKIFWICHWLFIIFFRNS